MIRLTQIIDDLTKPRINEALNPFLLKLIGEVINDTNILTVK